MQKMRILWDRVVLGKGECVNERGVVSVDFITGSYLLLLHLLRGAIVNSTK